MPIEKENEVRENARLAMDRVRHGPGIFTDTMIDTNIVDDKKTSSLWKFNPSDKTIALTKLLIKPANLDTKETGIGA